VVRAVGETKNDVGGQHMSVDETLAYISEQSIGLGSVTWGVVTDRLGHQSTQPTSFLCYLFL